MNDEELRQRVLYASDQCTLCNGEGYRVIRWGKRVACHCFYRGLFRESMSRYHRAGDQTNSVRARLFRADVAIAARVLAPELQLLWRLLHVEGGDWRECVKHPGLHHLDRGAFFTNAYNVEWRLGKELLAREIAPSWKYFDWGHAPILAVSTTGGTGLTRSPQSQNWQNRQVGLLKPQAGLTGTTQFNGRGRSA